MKVTPMTFIGKESMYKRAGCPHGGYPAPDVLHTDRCSLYNRFGPLLPVGKLLPNDSSSA